VREHGRWFARTDGNAGDVVQLVDVASRDELTRIIQAHARNMDICKGGLVRCFVGRVGSQNYLSLQIHHLIVDAISARAFAMAVLDQRKFAHICRDLAAAPSFAAYVASVERAYRAADRDEKLSAFNALVCDPAPLAISARALLRQEPYGHFQRLVLKLPVDSGRLERALGNGFDLWLGEGLAALFLFAIGVAAEIRGIYPFLMCVPGREDAAGRPLFATTLGFLAYPALGFTLLDPDDAIEQALRNFGLTWLPCKAAGQAFASVAYGGWRDHDSSTTRRLRVVAAPDIVFNFYGRMNVFSSLPAVGTFTTPGIASTKNARRCNIDVSFYVRSSEIECQVAFNARALPEARLASVIETFSDLAKRVAAHAEAA
jgi:hypothetical protein